MILIKQFTKQNSENAVSAKGCFFQQKILDAL